MVPLESIRDREVCRATGLSIPWILRDDLLRSSSDVIQMSSCCSSLHDGSSTESVGHRPSRPKISTSPWGSTGNGLGSDVCESTTGCGWVTFTSAFFEFLDARPDKTPPACNVSVLAPICLKSRNSLALAATVASTASRLSTRWVFLLHTDAGFNFRLSDLSGEFRAVARTERNCTFLFKPAGTELELVAWLSVTVGDSVRPLDNRVRAKSRFDNEASRAKVWLDIRGLMRVGL